LVPRIIQKVYEGINSNLHKASVVKQKLFQKAYDARLKYFKQKKKEACDKIWEVYNG